MVAVSCYVPVTVAVSCYVVPFEALVSGDYVLLVRFNLASSGNPYIDILWASSNLSILFYFIHSILFYFILFYSVIFF